MNTNGATSVKAMKGVDYRNQTFVDDCAFGVFAQSLWRNAARAPSSTASVDGGSSALKMPAKETQMGAIVPRSYPKQPKPKCQATVEDYKNGTSYNLARSFTVPKHRQCSRYATSTVGKLCLCALHTKLALEGLVEEDGTVATRSALADVRRYPHKFADGLYSWAKGLKAEEIK